MLGALGMRAQPQPLFQPLFQLQAGRQAGGVRAGNSGPITLWYHTKEGLLQNHTVAVPTRFSWPHLLLSQKRGTPRATSNKAPRGSVTVCCVLGMTPMSWLRQRSCCKGR